MRRSKQAMRSGREPGAPPVETERRAAFGLREVRRLALALLLIAPSLAAPRCDGPRSDYDPDAPPATGRLVTYAGVLHVGGSGFGAAPDERGLFSLEVKCPDRARKTIPFDDPRVAIWRDDLVEARRVPGLRPGCRVTVHSEGRPVSGATGLLIDEVRAVESFDSGAGAWSKLRPLAIAFDPSSKSVYLNSEFHAGTFHMLGGTSSRAVPIRIPPSGREEGIFVNARDATTHETALAEHILVEPGSGAVWLSEGGRHLYTGSELNASRIVRYDPRSRQFRCWNVPHPNAQVMGLLWEEAAKPRMWAALAAHGGSGALVSFLPHTFTEHQTPCGHDFEAFEEEASYPATSCAGEEKDGCFETFVLPASPGGGPIGPAHLAIDGEGNVWATAFLANGLVRLTPTTRDVTFFPLPPSEAGQWLGSGPWDVLLDANGDTLVVSEFFDAQIVRFDLGLVNLADCTRLDGAGRNACVTEYTAPVDTAEEHLHSLVRDGDAYYFTISTGASTLGDARLGRLVLGDGWSELLLFPPLASIRSTSTDAATGIAIDPAAGTLFVANPELKSIEALHHVSEGGCGLGAELAPLLAVLARLRRRRGARQGVRRDLLA